MEEEESKKHFGFFKSKKDDDDSQMKEEKTSSSIGSKIGTFISTITSGGKTKSKQKKVETPQPPPPSYPREYDILASNQFQSESAAPKDTRNMTEGTTETTTDTMGSFNSFNTNLEFNPNTILPEEMQENQEFFLGRNTKTPERYMSIRNQIIDMWNETKPNYLSKTQVRNKLKDCGDVNAIGRIHNFLEKAGWINCGPVIGKYIRSKNRIQKKSSGAPMHHSDGMRSSSASFANENEQCGSLKFSEDIICYDESHIIMENSLLLLMDLHSRLINHSYGLILGHQMTDLLFVVDGVFPLNIGIVQMPLAEQVIGIYHSNNDSLPIDFNTYYPYWRFEIIYMNHNNTFHFFNKCKGGLEVRSIEIIKKETAKSDLERCPYVPLIMNAYIMSHLNENMNNHL